MPILRKNASLSVRRKNSIHILQTELPDGVAVTKRAAQITGITNPPNLFVPDQAAAKMNGWFKKAMSV